MNSAEHAVEEWLTSAQVITLSREQIALLVEAMDQYAEQREAMALRRARQLLEGR